MRRTIAIVGVSLIVVLMLAATAFAAEVSREEFTASAEPICKTGRMANERILATVEKEVKEGKLKTASVKFAKASTEQAKALRQLEALPRPAADEARLTKWFSYLKLEADLFASAGKKLKAGNKGAASQDISKLSHNVNKANNQVLPFGFHYCLLPTTLG